MFVPIYCLLSVVATAGGQAYQRKGDARGFELSTRVLGMGDRALVSWAYTRIYRRFRLPLDRRYNLVYDHGDKYILLSHRSPLSQHRYGEGCFARKNVLTAFSYEGFTSRRATPATCTKGWTTTHHITTAFLAQRLFLLGWVWDVYPTPEYIQKELRRRKYWKVI